MGAGAIVAGGGFFNRMERRGGLGLRAPRMA